MDSFSFRTIDSNKSFLKTTKLKFIVGVGIIVLLMVFYAIYAFIQYENKNQNYERNVSDQKNKEIKNTAIYAVRIDETIAPWKEHAVGQVEVELLKSQEYHLRYSFIKDAIMKRQIAIFRTHVSAETMWYLEHPYFQEGFSEEELVIYKQQEGNVFGHIINKLPFYDTGPEVDTLSVVDVELIEEVNTRENEFIYIDLEGKASKIITTPWQKSAKVNYQVKGKNVSGKGQVLFVYDYKLADWKYFSENWEISRQANAVYGDVVGSPEINKITPELKNFNVSIGAGEAIEFIGFSGTILTLEGAVQHFHTFPLNKETYRKIFTEKGDYPYSIVREKEDVKTGVIRVN